MAEQLREFFNFSRSLFDEFPRKLDRDLILVLGSEDRGLSRSVRSRCHQIVSIPSYGYPGSLNISVAGGIILAEIIRQRSVEKSG